MLARSAGAPRLIDWTGERCVPWTPSAQLVYEHLHRYLWAGELIGGRRVLDLGSGEGFGAAILAQAAESVLGVDIDARSVKHASLNYIRDNLSFMVGDARDLSGFEDASFDFVVAFELIEHLAEHDRVMDEIARVLAPRGVLVMSTPDRRTYAEDNPFHVRELGQEELVNLAERRFRSVSVFGQRTITGSLLTSVDGHEHETARTFFIERMGDEWRMADRISPLYLVMLASNAEMPTVPDYSTLGDCGLELVREQEPSVRELMALRAQTARDAESIAFLESELSAARHAFRLLEESVLWQIVQRVRGTLIAALGGPGSRPVRLLQGCLRLLGRAMRSSNSGGAQAPAGPGAAPPRSVRVPVPDEGQDHLRGGVNPPSGNDHDRRDGLARARGERLVHSAEIGARRLP